MFKTVLKIDGMKCGMCETHINDLVRKSCKAKKVTSSHTRGETTIISDEELNVEELSSAIAATGYRVTGSAVSPYEKKGLFSFLKK